MKNFINKYFAAANGYDGFRSYFNKIFDPHEFERIYVLKGGPGTGKSSLMKRTKKYFLNKEYECEEIYCSSDPNSLDGVIVKSKDKKVAIIDGTAPHETDAKIPGAIDEIIDLGIAWKKEELIHNREQILSLNNDKGRHYKNAYEYLNLAGQFSTKISSRIKKSYNSSNAEIFSILSNIGNISLSRNEEVKLISSFGKTGYKTLNLGIVGAKKCISVSGVYGSEYIFMNELYDEIKRMKLSYILSPSPFSNDKIEAIYIHNNETFITTNFTYDIQVKTDILLNEDVLNEHKDIIQYYSHEVDSLLKMAQKELSLASECHFALEALYTPTMNFNILDSINQKVIEEIDVCLK